MKTSRIIYLNILAVILISVGLLATGQAQTSESIKIQQITFGPKHHYFGYIGQVKTIPWNKSGRYIVALQTDYQDRMPGPDDAAKIILLDTHNDYTVQVVDRTLGWNPQQGTMLYWNPEKPETQFFFNDRDPKTGKVFAVLYDINYQKRIREYRFGDTPVGNSGVAQNGGWFLGINYARMARLRPVTGYPETCDWTVGIAHPDNDGIFKINANTGEKSLLVSFNQLADQLRSQHPDINSMHLFINHTLWNRDDDRILFYCRGDFGNKKKRVNQMFTIHPDGSGLSQMRFIGGHPEWELGHRAIGTIAKEQVVYDTDLKKIVRKIGTRESIPNAEGDIALSPDGKWFANGYRKGKYNFYVLVRMMDGLTLKTKGVFIDQWTSGKLRLDAGPLWNRESDGLLVPGIAGDTEKTRQLFLVKW